MEKSETAAKIISETGTETFFEKVRKWQITSSILLIAGVILLIGWISTNTKLYDERNLREELAKVNPLTITEIKLRNRDKNGVLGSYTTNFIKKDIRYINYRINLRNNFVGIKSLAGDLGVKFISPDGSIFRNYSTSPKDFTFNQSVYISSDSKNVEKTNGWGNDEMSTYESGDWRIEFWWQNKKIGEKHFTVSYE